MLVEILLWEFVLKYKTTQQNIFKRPELASSPGLFYCIKNNFKSNIS